MLRPKATYNDNRGQHISDSEEYLRARIKALEKKIEYLEMDNKLVRGNLDSMAILLEISDTEKEVLSRKLFEAKALKSVSH